MQPYAFEWVRLRTLRSTWLLAVISLAYSAVMGFFAKFILDANPSEFGWLSAITFSISSVPSLFSGLIGVFAVGHEYRHGSIRCTLSVLPKRENLLLAKIAVPALFCFALSVLCMAAASTVAWILVHERLETPTFTPTVARVVFGAALMNAGFAMIGAGFTARFRSQLAGILTMILGPLIAENAVIAGLRDISWFDRIEGVREYMPFTAGQAMLHPPADLFDPGVKIVSPLVGGVVYFGFVAFICALGMRRFVRSDA